MARIIATPTQGQMTCLLTSIPAFPGGSIACGIPESIGDTARSFWFGTIKPTWTERENGAWRSVGTQPGELSYTLDVAPAEDTVDIRIALTNESGKPWKQSHAFNCINVAGTPELADYECVRHWTRWNGRFRKLIEVPRRFGPRPAVQLYGVEGAPRGAEIPFVAGFASTPENVALEGWLAVISRDGRKLAATVSKPALYLFQNMEYSCIHSAQGLGALEPGETGRALTRLYFVESSLEDWHRRMRREIKTE